MTKIGYAVLDIVPSLLGVSASINKQLAAMPEVGTNAGKQIGSNIATGVLSSQPGKRIGKDIESGVADGARGAEGQIKSRLSERLGSQVGSVVGKGIGAGIKLGITGAAGAAALAVGGIGVALTKGFDRLKSIDQAKFKLQALGNSATDVQTIMDNALASVKGTSFGLQDAATAAASAVAAGIKPGEQLTKYLGEVGDAAAVAGTNFEDMGSIFNKIQTSNKAYTDDLQQLSDRGLPIFQWLQKEYGVTGEKLSKMVQDGEVDAAHFQAAIDKNIGGAALKMGQSFDGAVDNMEASIARLGANFITSILGGDPANALAGPTEAIGILTEKFDQVGVWVNAHRGEIHQFFSEAASDTRVLAGYIKNVGEFLINNEGLIKNAVILFAGWKTITGVSSLLGALGGLSGALRDDLPKAAGQGVAGINKAFALIAIPAIGVELAKQMDAFVDGLGPTFAKLNHFGTPDQWANVLKNGATGDPNRAPGQGTLQGGIPQAQLQAPAGTRDTGGLPTHLNGLPIAQATAPAGTRESGGVPVFLPLPRATGGPVFGAGTATSDSIPAMLSNGEHVWTAAEVAKAGGQAAMYRMRAAIMGYDNGGAILPGQPRDSTGQDDPFKQMMMFYAIKSGVKPNSGVGNFNPGIKIDTSNVSIAPAFDQWSLTFGDVSDITALDPDERERLFRPTGPRAIKPGQDATYDWLHGFAGGGAVGNAAGAGAGGGGLVPGSAQLREIIQKRFGISNIGGYRPADKYGEHSTGRALDVMVGNNKSEGDAVKAFALDNASAIDLKWVIWQQHLSYPGGGGYDMEDRGSPTANHRDHVHIFSGPGITNGLLGALKGAGPDVTAAPAAQAGPPVGDSAATPADLVGSSSSSGGRSLPSSLSGLSSFGLDSLGSGVGTTGSGSDLSKFGSAAGSAVSGQVSSALGVLGINDTPPILQAATQLLGGLKVGGSDRGADGRLTGKSDGSIFNGANPLGGGSAAPLSATSTNTAAQLPDSAHGLNAGQAPGPVFNTTIQARDAEGALDQWRRWQDQRIAAKTGHL